MNDLYGFRFGKAAAGSWPKPPTADAHIVDLGAVPAVEVYARQVAPTTTTSAPTSTTDRPFFPDPATITAHATSSADDDGNGSDSGSLAKSVLEYAILAVGLVLIGSFMLIRINRARRANQGPSAFFSMSSFRSPNHQLPTHRPTYPRTHGLPRVDLAYPPPSHSNPIRSNDTDAFGRRYGPGEFNDKDQLPPYEVAGGPPKYFELTPSGTRGNWNNRPMSQESRTTGAGHPRMSSATASVNHANARGEEERERADSDDHHDQHSTPPGLSSPTTEPADHPQPNTLANAENGGRNHD